MFFGEIPHIKIHFFKNIATALYVFTEDILNHL